MKYIRKITTFSLIALLVTVGAAQVQGEEIKWKTYHDKHGWSINYPSDWKIYKKGRIPGTEMELPKGTIYFIGKGGINLSVVLKEELPLPISLEEYVSIMEERIRPEYKEMGVYISEVVSEQKVKIDGESAIQVTYLAGRSPDELWGKQVYTITMKDSTAWAIICTADSALHDRVNEVYFEPMIQSFKFEVPRKAPFESISDFLSRICLPGIRT